MTKSTHRCIHHWKYNRHVNEIEPGSVNLYDIIPTRILKEIIRIIQKLLYEFLLSRIKPVVVHSPTHLIGKVNSKLPLFLFYERNSQWKLSESTKNIFITNMYNNVHKKLLLSIFIKIKRIVVRSETYSSTKLSAIVTLLQTFWLVRRTKHHERSSSGTVRQRQSNLSVCSRVVHWSS